VAELIVTVLYLLLLYAAGAMSVVGFAMMLGGPPWAGSVARALFLQPIASLATGLAHLVGVAVSAAATLTGSLLWAVITHVIDPFVVVIARALRAIFFPRRQ
jgi:hypothetical protein